MKILASILLVLGLLTGIFATQVGQPFEQNWLSLVIGALIFIIIALYLLKLPFYLLAILLILLFISAVLFIFSMADTPILIKIAFVFLTLSIILLLIKYIKRKF
ncbi:hypothetical protein BG261_10850 [Floricoccus tropicus]|uniref:Uncharacterized protein n=1 Tax=Floricoccus tropicus TaxID=1859473 RepID=A0A1E8GNM3_9LACT|nr:hypothetical protein [Floricoccus tropicus]OFI49767.1 hypothetical protein BG261_10850 [Floricoccus tropicus]